jgi:hypothetical protein
VNEGKSITQIVAGLQILSSGIAASGQSKCHIFNAPVWGDTLYWGSLRTAKSEGCVPLSKLRNLPEMSPIWFVHHSFLSPWNLKEDSRSTHLRKIWSTPTNLQLKIVLIVEE